MYQIFWNYFIRASNLNTWSNYRIDDNAYLKKCYLICTKYLIFLAFSIISSMTKLGLVLE